MDLKFDGIGFNALFLKGLFANQEEFMAYCKDNPHWFEGDENREKKLGQLFDIAQKMQSTTEVKDGEIIKQEPIDEAKVENMKEEIRKQADVVQISRTAIQADAEIAKKKLNEKRKAEIKPQGQDQDAVITEAPAPDQARQIHQEDKG